MRFSTALFVALVIAGPVSAGAMIDTVDLCSDPLTDGPQKLDRLPSIGWQPAAEPSAAPMLDLAIAQVLGFTVGIENLEERFALAPTLAGNFAQMATVGQITLWTREGAVLAVSIAETPEGGEHLACYFAGLPSEDLDALQDRYGGAEVLPDIELRATRFDETAMRFNPDVTYEMFSTWTRLTSDPARTPYTDAYRLERVQQP